MAEMPKNEGGRPLETGFSKNPVSEAPTLDAQGIDKNLAHRSRKMARMDEVAFEGYVVKEKERALKAGFPRFSSRVRFKAGGRGGLASFAVADSLKAFRRSWGFCGLLGSVASESLPANTHATYGSRAEVWSEKNPRPHFLRLRKSPLHAKMLLTRHTEPPL
jgi:hypothetical protein